MTASDLTAFEVFSRKVALGGDDLTSADYQTGIRLLAGYIRYKYPSLAYDCDDLAADVMLKVVKRASNGQPLDADSNPASFLRQMTDWVALDRLRSVRSHENLDVLNEWSLEDDQVAQSLDRTVNADLVVRALARARQEGDNTAFKVATLFLAEAESSGRAPTQRAIAKELGLSQEGVRQALLRYRRYLT